MDSKLLEVYAPHVRRRVRTRLTVYGLQGKVDSLDICQSIMAQLVRRNSLDDVARADCPSRFLAKAVQNKIIEVLRRYKTNKRNASREAADTVDWGRVAGRVESPSVQVIRQEIYQEILGCLDDEEREVCRMRSEGQKFADIAEAMGLTADAVRMKYNRAIARLKDRFQVEG